MKYINYLFFNLYVWFSKSKKDLKQANPETRVFLLFGLCIGGWSMDIMVIYFRIIAHMNYIPDYFAYAVLYVAFITVMVAAKYYTSNNRYLTVVERLTMSNDFLRKNFAIFCSFLFIILPYIVLFVLTIMKIYI